MKYEIIKKRIPFYIVCHHLVVSFFQEIQNTFWIIYIVDIFYFSILPTAPSLSYQPAIYVYASIFYVYIDFLVYVLYFLHHLEWYI